MPFFRKQEKTGERIESCRARMLEISAEIKAIEGKIENKKGDVAQLLGMIATDNKEADKMDLQSARKVLAKLNGEHLDLIEQKEFLQKEIFNLEKELARARVRDLPGEMQKYVSEFNQTLEQAVDALTVLEELHGKLHKASVKFRDLSIDRDKAMSALKEVRGLDLPEGFGKLSRVPSPHRYDLMVPDRFSGIFIDFVLTYRQKCKNYEEFKVSNPDAEEKIKRTRERDEQSSQTPGRLTYPRPWQ